MSKSTTVTALCAFLALSACEPLPPAPDLPEFDEELNSVGVRAGWGFSNQLLPDRFVVLRSSGVPCSPVMGEGGYWAVSPLFEPKAPATSHASAELRRYCIFERVAGSGAPGVGSGLSSPDRVAIAGMGSLTNHQARAYTHGQIQPTPNLPVFSAPNAVVAIIDTIPDNTSGIEPSKLTVTDRHGTNMMGTLEWATCDRNPSSTNCAGVAISELGLAWSVASDGTFSRPAHGGSVGSQADVAQAIVAAVDRWRDMKDAGEASGLVINLSLGWHPDAGGTTTPYDQPVAAVHAALEYAACNDAIVIAAAGQQDTATGGSNHAGALYPAAWEREQMPSSTDCSIKYGVVPGSGAYVPSYRPLIYAVGAVEADKDPISVSRPGSEPGIVAAGDHLMRPGTAGVQVMTGTSVSAGIVSGIATLIREVHPSMPAHEVMAHIHASGWATPRSALVKVTGSGTRPVRIASACRALAQSCIGKSCAATYPMTSCPSSFGSGVTTSVPSTVDITLGDDDSGTCATSFDYFFEYGTTANTINCPTEEAVSGKALAVVQSMPPNHLCPWCPVHVTTMPPIAELHTTDPLADYDNVTIAVHFESGDPDRYPVNTMYGGTDTIVELPEDALEDRAVGNAMTGVTLEYMDRSSAFSYSESLYLE